MINLTLFTNLMLSGLGGILLLIVADRLIEKSYYEKNLDFVFGMLGADKEKGYI